MPLGKLPDGIPVPALMGRIRPRESVPRNLAVEPDRPVVREVERRVSRAEDGLSDVLF